MGTDVVFRAERIVPHVGVADRHATHARASSAPTERAPNRLDEIEEVDQRPGAPGINEGLADRLAAARARWSQLTFYLLDAESWR
jgi:hypothetical protein